MRRPVLKLLALFGVLAGALTLIAVLVGGIQGPEDLEKGRPDIGASAKGADPIFAPHPEEATSEEEEEAPATEEFTFIDPATVPPKQAIKGTVKNLDGKPIAGAEVYALKTRPGKVEFEELVRTRTRTDGSYFMGPVEGNLTIEAVAEGLARHRKWAQAGATVDFELGLAGMLSGSIKHEGSGEPCPDALVRVYMYGSDGKGGGGDMRTDGGGAYRFPDLPPGSYTLSVYPPKSPVVTTRGIEIKEGEETVRDILVVPGIKVLGRITDYLTGKPVEGAEVSVSSNPRLKATSNAEGRYEIVGIGPVKANIAVKAKGYLKKHAWVTPPAEGGDITHDMKIGRGGSARGRVFDPTGKPVAGAKVSANAYYLFQGGEQVFTAEEDGTFLVEGLRPGQIHLYAYSDGFAPGQTGTAATIIAGEETSGVEIRLKVPGSLSGKVTDAMGKALEGANVQIWATGQRGVRRPVFRPAPIQTQADGTYAHTDLANGVYGIRVEKKGYTAEVRQNLSIAEGGSQTGVDFSLQKGSFIAGKVVDGDGKPVAAVAIRAHPQHSGMRVWQQFQAQTKEDGTFRLEGMPEGTYYVRARKTGLGTAYAPSVASGTEGLELRMKELNALTGTVVIAGSGKPAAAFRIAVYHANSTNRWPVRSLDVADATGKFKIKGLGPGTYEIEATTKSGLISQRVRADLMEGFDTPPAKLVLEQGPVLKGLVQTPDGRPAVGATVNALPSDGQGGRRSYTRTDKEGRFVLAPLRPGTYVVRVTHRDWVENQDIVGVTQGMESTVTLSLRAGGSVRILVTDPAGEPVSGASVSLRRPDGNHVQLDWNKYQTEIREIQRSNPGFDMARFWNNLQRTDEDGCCVRRFLPPELLTVMISCNNHRQAKAEVQIREGRESIVRIKLVKVSDDGMTDEERKRAEAGR